VTRPTAVLLAAGGRALRRSATWWTIGIVAFSVINIAFWPSLEGTDSLASLQESTGDLLEAFGAQNIATPQGYLDGQMYALMLPLLLSGMAIAMATALTAGDEDAGRLELLHALPVDRRSIWLTRFGSTLGALLAVSVVVAAATVLACSACSLEVGVARIVAATFGCAALAVFHAGVGYLLAGLGTSRAVAVGGAVLVLVAGYVVSFVFPLSEPLAGLQKASPWYWAIGTQPVSEGIAPLPVLGLLVLSAALIAVGTAALERRDIRSA
jgi:ABC-2 type transport system permease protein